MANFDKARDDREPELGVPFTGTIYGYPAPVMTSAPPQQLPPRQSHMQADLPPAGSRPPNAIYGPYPPTVGLSMTFFADTLAPFECPHCGEPGITSVKSSFSAAACVACLVTLWGCCFLTRSYDCLWHKHHYCNHCGEKVADFMKDDLCLVADPMHWTEPSYAVPA